MYVGVILWYMSIHQSWTSVPHVCGGDPELEENRFDYDKCSPCMWGWSSSVHESYLALFVFPMYVGVILLVRIRYNNNLSVPHVCGGDPNVHGLVLVSNVCSPCMWGWSYVSDNRQYLSYVFPMYVGVILANLLSAIIYNRVPHVCGGDPPRALPRVSLF